ncbi:MAG: acyltransferase [Lachnospiraceae bacterium]|jgi:surface polysaccharide O-acyltransferase-like enzyme
MKRRLFGLDCVRIMALCLLFWLHFFLRNGFYSRQVAGPAMIAAAAVRCICLTCVPLFLMLTGCLKCGKEYKKGYYHSLPVIIISWVIISFICLFYDVRIAGQHKSAYAWAVDFFSFDLANYSWYVNMYIGLDLMSPFINKLWNALENKKSRAALLIVMISITFLPTTLNSFKFDGETAMHLLPGFWVNLWFITYYLIGCWIRTYQPTVRRIPAIAVSIALGFFAAVVDSRTGGAETKFYDGYTMTYSHLVTAASAVLLFLAVYRIRTKSSVLKFMAKHISAVSLEMYLISCVFDQKIYRWQYGKYPPSEYWWRGLLCTAAVFGLSFGSGFLVHQASGWIWKGIRACGHFAGSLFHRDGLPSAERVEKAAADGKAAADRRYTADGKAAADGENMEDSAHDENKNTGESGSVR